MTTLKEKVGQVIQSGVQSVKQIFSTDAFPEDQHMFYPIGRPRGFRPEVDPYGHYSQYLRTKMSIIDIIPCHYNLYLDKFKEDVVVDQFFEVSFASAISKFKEMCFYYGLTEFGSVPWSGIRLYTTDETTASDVFTVTYHESFFQKFSDALSNLAKDVREVFKSLTSQAGEITEQGVNYAAQKAGEGAEKLGVSGSVAKKITDALTSVGNVLVTGKRVQFPKVWENTSNTSTLTASVKLVSPYGHPQAIKEFIIKPLMMLFIIAAPRTTDGLSYGGTMPLNIRAYGINYITLGSIASITIRRGGNDTAFNVYKQPIWLDISIEFQQLFDGCALYAPSNKEIKPEFQILNDPALVHPLSSEVEQLTVLSGLNPLTTMGTLLTSFEPVITTGESFQDYGSFIRPDRGEGYVGEGKTFTAMGGILSNIMSKLSKYGITIPDELSPLLKDVSDIYNNICNTVKSVMQQGTSIIINASYNIAKSITSGLGGFF